LAIRDSYTHEDFVINIEKGDFEWTNRNQQKLTEKSQRNLLLESGDDARVVTGNIWRSDIEGAGTKAIEAVV
jgi:hypothetical protein